MLFYQCNIREGSYTNDDKCNKITKFNNCKKAKEVTETCVTNKK